MAEGRKVIVKNSEELAEQHGADEAYTAEEVTGSEEELTEMQAAADFVNENPTTVEDLADDELIWPGPNCWTN
jgi:hypothetical protein